MDLVWDTAGRTDQPEAALPHPLPPFHHTVTPASVVRGAAKLLTFLETAFGGEVLDKYEGPDGAIAHAEVKLGDSVLMIGEPMGGPEMPAVLSLYVEDVDETYAKAPKHGATSLSEPVAMFYGHRTARVADPCGNHWAITTVTEILTKEEIMQRMSKMGG
jgi:PhnB protein